MMCDPDLVMPLVFTVLACVFVLCKFRLDMAVNHYQIQNDILKMLRDDAISRQNWPAAARYLEMWDELPSPGKMFLMFWVWPMEKFGTVKPLEEDLERLV